MGKVKPPREAKLFSIIVRKRADNSQETAIYNLSPYALKQRLPIIQEQYSGKRYTVGVVNQGGFVP
jgi:hypothetical protein